MTNRPPRDLVASVRQRLMNPSRDHKKDFQRVLTRYGLERLLYRLTQSPHAAQFILKGAALFQLWTGQPHRDTRDLDLLGQGDPQRPPRALAGSGRSTTVVEVPMRTGAAHPSDRCPQSIGQFPTAHRASPTAHTLCYSIPAVAFARSAWHGYQPAAVPPPVSVDQRPEPADVRRSSPPREIHAHQTGRFRSDSILRWSRNISPSMQRCGKLVACRPPIPFHRRPLTSAMSVTAWLFSIRMRHWRKGKLCELSR